MSVTGRIREFLKAFVKGEALNFPTTIRSSSRINNGRTLRDGYAAVLLGLCAVSLTIHLIVCTIVRQISRLEVPIMITYA